jgi:small-conductance mechanosensitive channel
LRRYEETAQRLKDNFMVKVHGYQYPDADFVGFGESTLDFSLQFFIDDLVGDHCERLGDVFSEIGTELKIRFDAQHIEIPFPQRDIWVRNIVPTRAETIASLQTIL